MRGVLPAVLVALLAPAVAGVLTYVAPAQPDLIGMPVMSDLVVASAR